MELGADAESARGFDDRFAAGIDSLVCIDSLTRIDILVTEAPLPPVIEKRWARVHPDLEVLIA